MSAVCSFCKVNDPRPGQRYCKSCHALYQSINRPRFVNLSPKERLKATARAKANVYQRRGKLIPQPCVICGTKQKVEKHHPDYSKALEVVWICRPCHRDVHSGSTLLPEVRAKFREILNRPLPVAAAAKEKGDNILIV